MTQAPVVSIVVPVFNGERFLERALHSIVAQTFDAWEIVLVDDGSTDGTAGIARRYADELGDRLHYIRQDNRGSSDARNRGIEASRGQFVAFLDSDDEFAPAKIERQLALFDACPELGLVYSDYAYVDLDGVHHASAFDTKCRMARAVTSEIVGPNLQVCTGDFFTALLREYFIATIVGMVRREVLGGCSSSDPDLRITSATGGGRYTTSVTGDVRYTGRESQQGHAIRFDSGQKYAEEWLFYLKVAGSCRAGFVDEPLSVHHFVDGSLARTDRHRNVRRYRDILHVIQRTFDDLTRPQRAIVRDHLARTYRQLGYDAQRSGRNRDALGCFARAYTYSFDLAVLRRVASTMGRCLLGRSATSHDSHWMARSG